jgi:large subunit ribosomal protein L6
MKSVTIPQDIKITIIKKKKKTVLKFKNANGLISLIVNPCVLIFWKKQSRLLSLVSKAKQGTLFLGLTHKSIVSILNGLSRGCNEKVNLVGRGYKYEIRGKVIYLNLGFSHAIAVTINKPTKLTTNNRNEFQLISLTQQNVNQVSFNLGRLRTPDPYKGKGIHLDSAVSVKLKEGKKKMY